MLQQARDTVIQNDAYQEALHNASEELGEYRDAIARAIVAQAILDCEQQEKYSPILTDAQLRDEVELLITAGSQAPFLYEINALYSLEYGEPLPDYFPSWVNIYDLRDFLSYIGSNVFPNKVQDVLVDSKQPFPRSHGAYWTNQAMWKAIIPRLL